MPSGVQDAIAVVGTIAAVWAFAALVLVAVRPKGMDVADAVRFVPDVIGLLRRLTADRTLARTVRWPIGLLLVYLVSPIDLVPDFVPVLGYADDALLIAVVLRWTARRVGHERIEDHWTGSTDGLALLGRMTGSPPA